MAKTRKTEKSVEIHEVFVIRTSGSLPPLCADCGTVDAVMVPAEQAALVAHVSVRMIFRWVETDVIHYREVSGGSVIVCLKSLPTTTNQVTSALSGSDKSENGD